MKTKEFIEKIINMGYEVESDNGYLYIKLPNPTSTKEYVVGYIGIINPYILSLDFDWEDENLFDLMVKYARTPREERVEEQKYYLKHRRVELEGGNYLNLFKDGKNYVLSNSLQEGSITTQFTKDEIEEIKDKYNTDLSDFEVMEVEE